VKPFDFSRKRLEKRARRGFHGYPLATIAYYGPTNEYASKVAVGIVQQENASPVQLRKWFATEADVRHDQAVAAEVLAFIEAEQANSVVMTRGIIGCPHEEGIDYPEGTECPECPFWRGRDRWRDV
jgi:hypothetical protein